MSKLMLLSSSLILATCVVPVANFWFFSCRHGNGHGRAGDACSLFCQCHAPFTCMAGAQQCVAPSKLAEHCHATRPCGKGLSCHPGLQRCYHVPRRYLEPCVAGYECGSGLSCEPGVQVCYHNHRQFNEPCAVGFSCAHGLSCQPGTQRCLHYPRHEGEACSLGFECGEGLECTLCSKPYLTCQMAKVPQHDDEFYKRPFNMIAFLVTHNAYSHGARYAVWARNQRVGVTQQLRDGARGLMLDIFPGWGKAEVCLCHETCFWGGATDLHDTLVEIRQFLETNPREVVTIIFEDYLKNPTILKHVFDKAGVSKHVLDSSHWGTVYKNWPTLEEMRRLGRLVVFNNNGLEGFPYTQDNMWFYVRENRYGQPGLDTETCVDRGESRLNADFSDNWSLVLVNWFGTATNPLNPCLNSYRKIQRKLVTCAREFGQLANFLAVDYYEAGQDGGAFKAVTWLNERWKEIYRQQFPGLSERQGMPSNISQLAPRDAEKLGSVINNNSSKDVTLQEVYEEVDSDESKSSSHVTDKKGADWSKTTNNKAELVKVDGHLTNTTSADWTNAVHMNNITDSNKTKEAMEKTFAYSGQSGSDRKQSLVSMNQSNETLTSRNITMGNFTNAEEGHVNLLLALNDMNNTLSSLNNRTNNTSGIVVTNSFHNQTTSLYGATPAQFDGAGNFSSTNENTNESHNQVNTVAIKGRKQAQPPTNRTQFLTEVIEQM